MSPLQVVLKCSPHLYPGMPVVQDEARRLVELLKSDVRVEPHTAGDVWFFGQDGLAYIIAQQIPPPGS